MSLILALLLGAIGALPLILLTPPFQVPDEGVHFYRAFEISNLQILSDVQNGASGAVLPKSLPELWSLGVYTAPVVPTPLRQSLQHLSIPLNKSQRQFVAFPSSAFYSPLPYIPQVLGIAVGRLFGLGPLGLLYLGRLFNGLAALGLLGLAVYAAPFGQEIILLVGLLPMSLYLYASVSADATLIGCALLFTALSMAAATRGNWQKWELATAAACGAVFCSVKPVYLPLLFAALLPQLLQRKKVADVIRSHAILIGVPLAATACWMALTRSSMTSPIGGFHPPEQLHLILHRPMFLVHALFHTLRDHDRTYRCYSEVIGVLGWLTIRLRPGITYLLPVLAMVLLAIVGIRIQVDFTWLRRLWFLALAIASSFLVYLALYLISSNVGQGTIDGVQGRYFIPVLAMAGMAAIRKAPANAPAWRGLTVVVVVVLLQIAAMDFTILSSFKVL